MNNTLRRHTRALCLAGLLAAVSFALGLLSKTIFGEMPVRFTLEGLPVVLAGLVLGPVYGGLVGVLGDLLSCLLAGQTPLPLISVGAFLVGAVPGVLRLLCCRTPTPSAPPRFLFILLFDGAAHTLGSVLVKSLALSLYFGFNTLPIRLPIYLGVVLLESYLLYVLLRSHDVRRELERLLSV